MSSASSNQRHFPSRIAELGFSVTLPDNWISHDLPPEEPDFSTAAALYPLAIVTAANAAMAFACAARPAYEDGTLHDWAWFFLRQNELTPRAVGPGEAGGHPAMIGEAGQNSDLGPMTVRFALLEDGGRMVHFSLTAPDEFDDVARKVWFAALASFQLASPRGPTVAVLPPVEAAPAPAQEPTPEAPSGAGSEEAEDTFAAHALAGTDASFDPEHPVNARLRNNGVGFVPNLITSDAEARTGTFAAAALMRSVTIPFGWHLIDDSRRTLIFEPSGNLRISIDIASAEGRDTGAILDEIETATRDAYPAPEFVRGHFTDIAFLGARGISENGEPVEHYWMLLPAPGSEDFVRGRITTTPERRTEAGNLAELILRSVSSLPCAQPVGAPGD